MKESDIFERADLILGERYNRAKVKTLCDEVFAAGIKRGAEMTRAAMAPPSAESQCQRCAGNGTILRLSDNSPDAHDVDVCCDHCQGSGAAVDAAKYLAAALAGEKFRHMQLWGEYRNFHRSLCARFGYGHDPVHFRRDLASLEEAIVAKVSAPAAGDALEWTLISDRLPEIPDGAPGKRIHILVGRHYEGRWFSWSLWYGPRGQDLRFYEEFADEDADGDDVELTKDDDCATHWRYMPAGPAIAQQKGEA